MVIDWRKRPRPLMRLRLRLPCWLVGHFEIHRDPTRLPKLMWCTKCHRFRTIRTP